MKKRVSKKGLSIMISYVLLITFAIVISSVVYLWLSKYVPREGLNCPDGVSIYVGDADCGTGFLTLNVKNNGRFDIAGYFIHATNDSNQELATIDLSPNLISGGSNLTKSILFEPAIEPDNEKISMFKLDNKIYSIEIVPFRYQKTDNKMRFVQCGNARIKEKIDCEKNCKNLAALYHFEGDAKDDSGNENNGEVFGAAITTGKFGQAFNFNGKAFIRVNTTPSLDINGSEISIAFWFNFTGGGIDKGMITKAYTTDIMTSPWYQYGIELMSDGRLNFIYGNETNYYDCSSEDFVTIPNELYFAVFTGNKTSRNWYINGILNNTCNSPSEMVKRGNTNLNIGADSRGDQLFNGTIDEVAIWSRELSKSEVSQLYNSDSAISCGLATCTPDCGGKRVCDDDNCDGFCGSCMNCSDYDSLMNKQGLVSWWGMNGNANDGTGRNNGTLINQTNCDVPSVCGKACSFPGNDEDYIRLNYTESILKGGNGTFLFWLHPFFSSLEGSIMGNDNMSYNYFKLYSGNDEFMFSTKTSDTYHLIYDSNLVNTKIGWHFYAVMLNNDSIKIYYDTQLINESYIEPDAFELRRIGVGLTTGPFDGEIDEFMFFNRTLSLSEMQYIYEKFK